MGVAQQHHTATHLLQSALKEVLGEEVGQKGSLVRFDGLRFDFNNPKGLSDAQLAETEAFINAWIQQDQPVENAEMPIAEAKARGATAMFGEKYGETVRVVDVPGLGTLSLCTLGLASRPQGGYAVRGDSCSRET